MCCVARIASAQSPSELRRLLDSVVPAAMATERIPGVVVSVVSDGRLIVSRGYGAADLETKRPMTDSTIVRIGSISKVMTAVAVAHLADRGRVQLDSGVTAYLRDIKLPSRYRRPTTVRHLLTHSAALDEIRPGPMAEGASSVQPVREYLRSRLVQYAPPGTATAYSTYGMALAGVLVEDVSGLPFERYLVDSIWRPLGMSRTSITIPDAMRSQTASPYDVEGDSVVRAPWEWYHTTPASSVNSTAQDMARFMIAQLTGRSAVLSERMTREMQREHVTMHPRLPGYGLGWQQIQRGDERGVQHGGDVAGFSSLVTLLPGRKLGVFVAGHREGSDLRYTVTRAVLDRVAPVRDSVTRPVSMHASRDAAARAVARYAGHYRANIVCHSCENPRPVAEIDVLANQDGTLSAFNGKFVEVSPRFFVREDGSRRFGFHEDSLGRITHLTLGSWQVLERVPMTGTSVDSAGIRRAALDYVNGWYEGDAARMERSLHSDLAKRIWRPDPERGGGRMENQTAMTLVQGTRRGWGRQTPEPLRRRDVEILEIFGNAASARARMTDWIDLMHLARVNGEWKIVNVLWEYAQAEQGERSASSAEAAAPRKPPQDPALRAEIQAVNDSMVAAFNRGDMLAVARFYADDARIDGERGELVQGRAAVDKYWASIRNPKSWKLDVIAVGGHRDTPYQIGRSTLVTAIGPPLSSFSRSGAETLAARSGWRWTTIAIDRRRRHAATTAAADFRGCTRIGNKQNVAVGLSVFASLRGNPRLPLSARYGSRNRGVVPQHHLQLVPRKVPGPLPWLLVLEIRFEHIGVTVEAAEDLVPTLRELVVDITKWF
jgi:CubicO group peptidase (beta-lactamase class C family)